ncbi:hypothetical protein Scep_000414 [Stephania cephalantha]|uniref:Uncharacterized protein n=1 Tax=Stephania cephalantha TaxID=152367 RepID=A0AAP0L647_9MAGN
MHPSDMSSPPIRARVTQVTPPHHSVILRVFFLYFFRKEEEEVHQFISLCGHLETICSSVRSVIICELFCSRACAL